MCHPQDCPPDTGDFRAQQCSAHADVRYHGQYHEWLPVYNDPDNPCALKCKAKGTGLVVELAPKVLDGTRCYTESLDMCISGVCQVGGRLRELYCFLSIKNFIFISFDISIVEITTPSCRLTILWRQNIEVTNSLHIYLSAADFRHLHFVGSQERLLRKPQNLILIHFY